MATDNAIRSVTNTLTSTTADTITINQVWNAVEITNHDSANWLWVTLDGATAVAEADNTTPVPPSSTKVVRGERAEGTNTIVIGVVGDGNKYTIEGVA